MAGGRVRLTSCVVSLDRNRYAERALDWGGVEATLQSLERETVALVTGESERSRVSVVGALRRIEHPFRGCLRLAVAEAVVTLYADDVVHAQLQTLGDGHFVITLKLRGASALLIGDPDLLTVDYEENPFPDEVSRDSGG